MIESKYGNRVPKTKIRRKPDSFELAYPNCSHTVKSSARVHEQLLQLKCGLFFDKILYFGYYFTVYWQNIIQVNVFQRFCAIFYMFEVKYVTFREPVLGLLSPDFVYV